MQRHQEGPLCETFVKSNLGLRHHGAAGGAGSGAAGGAALLARWCWCSNCGLKASLAWLVIKIGIG